MEVSVDDIEAAAGDADAMHDTTPGPRHTHGHVSEPRVRRVGVLGTGTMGAELVRNLLAGGFDVQIWNRTPARADPLVMLGARYADSPAAAAAGVDVLITMLNDGPAISDVMTRPAVALRALKPGAVWVQMSTVGEEWCDRLSQLAFRSGTTFVDAPVSGSPRAARDAQLVILASGPRQLQDLLQPMFDVLGRRTLWMPQIGDGSRLKLALNNWLAILVEGMAETLALGGALGLNQHLVLEAIDGGALASPYALEKGRAMCTADFTPHFALRLAAKDATLAVEAAHDNGMRLPLTCSLLTRWGRVIENGYGDDDVAAAITASAFDSQESAVESPAH